MLEKEFEEALEEERRNQNFRNEDVVREQFEAPDGENQPDSSREIYRNSLTSNFSRETAINSCSDSTQSSIQCFGFSSNSPTWASVATEENPVNLFLAQSETKGGDFSGTDDSQLNPSKKSSLSLQDSALKESRLAPLEECKHSNQVAEASVCRESEIKKSEVLQKRKHSTSIPQIFMEGDGNGAKAPKLEQPRETTKVSGSDNAINDSSSGDIPNSMALGSVVDAEGVPVAGPSGMQKQTHKTTKEKSFDCNFCGKAFDTRQHLEVHERTHTGEKPFDCEFCGQRFRQKNHLTLHLLTHTGEKPFVCSMCGRGFTTKFGLTRHLLTHTGDKPFECEFCGHRVATKKNLRFIAGTTPERSLRSANGVARNSLTQAVAGGTGSKNTAKNDAHPYQG